MLTMPIPGQPITADWAAEVIAEIRANRVQPGPGVLVDRGPAGTVVSAAERDQDLVQHAVSGESVVAKVLSGSNLTGYFVRCYPRWPAETDSFTARLGVVEIAWGSELPVDTLVIAHLAAATLIGGGA
jgi:hypothetical protein